MRYKRPKYTEAFEGFWNEYPKGRRIGKYMAFKSWEKQGLEEVTKEVLEGVRMYKKSKQWQTVQFVPHPTTFLNQRRWEDEVEDEVTENRSARVVY